MITYKQITPQHFEVYSYELLISRLEVHKSAFKVINRHGSTWLPMSAKKHLKTLVLALYEKDLKEMKLAEYAWNENEGMLSIKKMKQILL